MLNGVKCQVFQYILKWYIGYCGGGGLVAKWCQTLTSPWTVARQAPLSIGFSRQE